MIEEVNKNAQAVFTPSIIFLFDGRRVDNQRIGLNLTVVYLVFGRDGRFVVTDFLGGLLAATGEKTAREQSYDYPFFHIVWDLVQRYPHKK